MNQETIIENLHRGICTMTVKGTGTMMCTLHPSFVPNNSSPLTENTNSRVSVWDVESQSWKMIDYDNVQSCNQNSVLREG